MNTNPQVSSQAGSSSRNFRNNRHSRAQRTQAVVGASIPSAQTISRTDGSIANRNTVPSISLDVASTNQLAQAQAGRQNLNNIEDGCVSQAFFANTMRKFYTIDWFLLIVFFVLLMITQVFKGDFGAILIVLDIIVCVHLIMLVNSYFSIRSAQQKKDILHLIVENILYLAFFLIVNGSAGLHHGFRSPLVIVTLLIILNHFMKAVHSFHNSKSSVSKFLRYYGFLTFIAKLLSMAQFVLILLRASKTVTFSWYLAFIPLFAMAFCLLIHGAFFLKLAVSKMGRLFWSPFTHDKLVGHIWIFGCPIIFIGGMVWSGVYFSNILNHPESYDPNNGPFFDLFITIVILSFVVLVYTHHYAEQIQLIFKCFTMLIDLDTLDAGKITEISNKLRAEMKEREEDRQIPVLLIKISNDYFRFPTRRELNVFKKLEKMKLKAAKENKAFEAKEEIKDKNLSDEDQQGKQKHTEVNGDLEKSFESLADLEKGGNTRCIVCFDDKQDAVYLNCGHGGVCYGCAKEILKVKGECHLCRNPIKRLLKVEPVETFPDRVKVLSIVKASEVTK